jgi:hypothetical protein
MWTGIRQINRSRTNLASSSRAAFVARRSARQRMSGKLPFPGYSLHISVFDCDRRNPKKSEIEGAKLLASEISSRSNSAIPRQIHRAHAIIDLYIKEHFIASIGYILMRINGAKRRLV